MVFLKNCRLIWVADKRLLPKWILLTGLRLSVWPLVIPEIIFDFISSIANELAYYLEAPAIKLNALLADHGHKCRKAIRQAGLMKPNKQDLRGSKI